MYCTMDSCIEDIEESEEFYDNQEIVEGLRWSVKIGEPEIVIIVKSIMLCVLWLEKKYTRD